MVKKRLIPVVLLQNGSVVQSKGFCRYQRLGNPLTIVQRLGDWASDELIYLDISPRPHHDLMRGDLNCPDCSTVLDILDEVARRCIIPLCFGGGIRDLEAARERLLRGADKITLNTAALRDPAFITQCAREFGSQAVVLSIDAKAQPGGGWLVHANGGQKPTSRRPEAWAAEAQERGAGEILLNSIDRDGTGQGYDLELIAAVAQGLSIPLIALGGARDWEHFAAGLEAGASAVAAANVFNHIENSIYKIKERLYQHGCSVRPPAFIAPKAQ